MQSFIVKDFGQDLGTLKYEYSDAKSELDAPSGKVGVKGIVIRTYVILLMAGLLAWFIASLVLSVQELGAGKAVVHHIAGFFGLVMAELILLFTGFDLWGKFARAAYRRKLVSGRNRYNRHGANLRELEAELKEADENKPTENALRIYPAHIAIMNNGERIVLDRMLIAEVNCYNFGKVLIFAFRSMGDEPVQVANILIPKRDFPMVARCFGENFHHIRMVSSADKRQAAGTMKQDDLPEEVREMTKGIYRAPTTREKLPTLFFMLIPVLIGVAITVIHCVLLPDMPIIFGIVFMGGGVIAATMVFDDYAIMAYGVTPILGGLLITALPYGILLTISQLAKVSMASLLMPFEIWHAVFSVFFGMGIMLAILGVVGFITCIRNRKK